MATPRWARSLARVHDAPTDDFSIGTVPRAAAAPSTSPDASPSTSATSCNPVRWPDALITAAQRIASNSTRQPWASLLSQRGCDRSVAELALTEEHWEQLLNKAEARGEPVTQTAGEILAWYLENYDSVA